MIGARASLAMEETETYALDPPTLSVDLEQRQAEPILATFELEREERVRARFSVLRREASPSLRGYAMATLCRLHLERPALATRAAILSTPVISRADAIAGLDLVAELEGDGELTDHLLAGLGHFLAVD